MVQFNIDKNDKKPLLLNRNNLQQMLSRICCKRSTILKKTIAKDEMLQFVYNSIHFFVSNNRFLVYFSIRYP
jgi:hypothetical protein